MAAVPRHGFDGDDNKQFHDVYDFKQQLGTGAFSVVHECVHKETGQHYAVKVINTAKIQDKLEMIELEIKILQTVGDHKGIVCLKEAFDTPEHVFLVMELVTGGELFDKIVELQFYSEKVASELIRQVLQAICHLHERNIVHRDLKPENLLLENRSEDSPVKLADFGLSSFVTDHEKLTKAVGTPGYIAPEILMTLDGDLDGYGLMVDEWSIGVIMYILLCGFPPFYAEDDDECFDMIIAGHFDFPKPYWDNISDDAKDLLRKLLVVDPSKRMTAEQALQHKWVSNASNEALTDNQAALKKFVAKQRWKKAITAINATQRLQMLLGKRVAKKKE